VGPTRNESKAFIIADTLDNITERFCNFISLNGFYTDRQVREQKDRDNQKNIAELAVIYRKLGVKEKELENEALNIYINK